MNQNHQIKLLNIKNKKEREANHAYLTQVPIIQNQLNSHHLTNCNNFQKRKTNQKKMFILSNIIQNFGREDRFKDPKKSKSKQIPVPGPG